MRSLEEQVAYLQGLAEGINLDGSTKEAKLLAGIIDALDIVAVEAASIKSNQKEIEAYLESIDADLYDLEDELYDEEDELVEVECPECHETVEFNADILDADETIEVTCPNCDATVFVNNGEYEWISDEPQHTIDGQEVTQSIGDEDL